MFGFGKKEKSLEDIFVDTLRNSDIEWRTNSSNMNPYRDYLYTGGGFVFRFSYDTITQDGNVISESLFRKVEKIAEESILRNNIEKLGGSILDDDLQQAINDTKKILTAKGQIENLVSVIETIRSKY